MSKLFCPFRNEYVAAQPEEIVRQRLLKTMVEDLGYPKSCIVVEKALNQLPHLSQKNIQIPDRRVDIFCYTKDQNSKNLVPLLLVECKAIPLSPKTLQQVSGYNHFVGAPFIAVANAESCFTGWVDLHSQQLQFIDFLPYYRELSKKLFS
ncbi:MAG: type I restriction enzyme HsdR N-terminal domain-containing protein [Chlamydiota bacterium]|nr:type I restriction enzyme HsdR N-terminal domain-containing protein [Chlamydiota bacterium]